jgi:hypothetical protein
MRFLLLLSIGVLVWTTAIVNVLSIDLIDGKCLVDNNCKSDEYCDHDFPNPIGACKTGHDQGHSCLFDRHCASKRCHFFRCKKRIQIKDGPCKINADCTDKQHCTDIKERDDLRQCVDRKCTGVCSKDSQCLSNKCTLFVCIKPVNTTSC